MKNSFSPTEVGAMFEALRSEFRLVGDKVESLLPLLERVSAVEEKLSALEIRTGTLETAVRSVFKTELPAMKSRLAVLEAEG